MQLMDADIQSKPIDNKRDIATLLFTAFYSIKYNDVPTQQYTDYTIWILKLSFKRLHAASHSHLFDCLLKFSAFGAFPRIFPVCSPVDM